MKLIAAALVAVLGAAMMVGCEASAKVGDPDGVDADHGRTTYKKTTVTEPDGDTKVHTEKRTTTIDR